MKCIINEIFRAFFNFYYITLHFREKARNLYKNGLKYKILCGWTNCNATS